MAKKYFIAGISTDVGKTVVSAVLTEALNADYWKPIQSGDLNNSDTDKVKNMISNKKSVFHRNTYAFKEPASPHYSASLENVRIDLQTFTLPKTTNHLIIEGAGGLMVPLNDKVLLTDLMVELNVEVILVANNYLGSINHTLMSIELMKMLNLKVKGIIFSGITNRASEDYILEYSKIPLLGRVPFESNLSKTTINKHAQAFKFLKK